MSKIFKDQSKLRIELTMGIDITDAVTHIIKYIKPDGTTGSFNATILDALSGTLEYIVNIDGTDIDAAGTWYLWAWVQLVDNRTVPGESIQMKVYDEGQ